MCVFPWNSHNLPYTNSTNSHLAGQSEKSGSNKVLPCNNNKKKAKNTQTKTKRNKTKKKNPNQTLLTFISRFRVNFKLLPCSVSPYFPLDIQLYIRSSLNIKQSKQKMCVSTIYYGGNIFTGNSFLNAVFKSLRSLPTAIVENIFFSCFLLSLGKEYNIFSN